MNVLTVAPYLLAPLASQRLHCCITMCFVNDTCMDEPSSLAREEANIEICRHSDNRSRITQFAISTIIFP